MIITLQILFTAIALTFFVGINMAVYYTEELPDKAPMILGAMIMSLPFFVLAVAIEWIWF
jgi:ABC-type dipeptide/oligopeptide/nickel transport system permease component